MMTPTIDYTNDIPSFAVAANGVLKNLPYIRNERIGEFVARRYEALKQSKYLRIEGKNGGDAFELLLADALYKYGVESDRIHRNIKADAKNADADILITPRPHKRKAIVIMAKTSLRERWKQEDRDGFIFIHNVSNCWSDVCNQISISEKTKPEIWAVTVKERADTSPTDAVDHAKRIGEKAGSIDTENFISVYDLPAMERLLEACL